MHTASLRLFRLFHTSSATLRPAAATRFVRCSSSGSRGVASAAAAAVPVATQRGAGRTAFVHGPAAAAAAHSMPKKQQQQQHKQQQHSSITPAMSPTTGAAASLATPPPRRRAAAAAAASAEAAVAAADLCTAAAAAAAVVHEPASRQQRSKRKSAEAAAGSQGGESAAAAAAAASMPKLARRSTSSTPTRSRKPSKAAAAAAAAEPDASDEEAASPPATPAGAPTQAKSKKQQKEPNPPRRTKVVIAAEVVAAAREGVFDERASLAGTYPHVALFQNGDTSSAWAQLQQELAAGDGEGATGAAAGQQQQHQQHQQPQLLSNGRVHSLAICRASGLGSHRQQVWLHSSTAAAPGGASSQQPDQQQQQQLTEAQRAQQLRLLPNLGYACLCATMRQYDCFASRDCVKATRYGPDGLSKVSALALRNAQDLLPLIRWNEAHGIRFWRLSSCIIPWMSTYASLEELPDWPAIRQALRAAGDLAKATGSRITFHPSEYVKIAAEKPELVDQSIKELEVHSRILDEMGFLPPTPHNKINIHVGGAYGGPDAALRRFSAVVNERLSPNCRARLTVENDDRPGLFSVRDLLLVHELTGIAIVCDMHHWQFCKGEQTQEEALRAAVATWPAGIRPVVHWSECPERPEMMRKAHSEYVDGPINMYGLEAMVDVMVEAKAKEHALLGYRQWVVDGCAGTGPRARREAELAADSAAAAAAASGPSSSKAAGTSSKRGASKSKAGGRKRGAAAAAAAASSDSDDVWESDDGSDEE